MKVQAYLLVLASLAAIAMAESNLSKDVARESRGVLPGYPYTAAGLGHPGAVVKPGLGQTGYSGIRPGLGQTGYSGIRPGLRYPGSYTGLGRPIYTGVGGMRYPGTGAVRPAGLLAGGVPPGHGLG